ncbi:hypothetical protein K435DRAFT_776751 [Dendrothele bispora CBS 962.96]|uniref:Uncharacterized protein n=1 Tax=Dendrothele bispora (strain CBS 962.96) TaxID=1314807 RepID=A0A4S8MC68_DENBC|nr:hypothetical protein K435DRAFT_776751 [Dendrothele bispora CBS 962.96]
MDQSYSYTLGPWRCNSNDDNGGKLPGTGWTRFHYESYIKKEFWLHVQCSPEATERIWNAWLHQKQYYLNVVKGDAFDQIDLITSLTFHLRNSTETRVVGHPVVMPRNVYLFIAPVTLNRCPESGSTGVRWLANRKNHYFWSFDPSGTTPLSRRVCDILGFPKYRTSISPILHRSFDYKYAAARYLQEIQGFDPLTQGYARAHGLPLVEVFSPLEHFRRNVVDSAEEGQEVLDMCSDAEETLSDKSDSGSVYADASSQLQTIPFPIPKAEQKLNWTTPQISDDLDLGNFEGDFSSNEESDDDSASQAFGLNPSFGSALTTGCKPSSWLRAYLIQEDVESWTGERERNEFCWRFTSGVFDTGDQEIYTFRRICVGCLHMGRHQQRIEEWYWDTRCGKCRRDNWRDPYIQIRKRRASI